MDDYIKRSDVLALQTELRFDQIEQLKHYRCRHIDPISVKLLEAADVRENVHGKWKQIGNGDFYRCSICSCGAQYGQYANFCPNCGADMRGEQDG